MFRLFEVVLARNLLIILHPVSISLLFLKNFNISFDYIIVFVANMYKILPFLFLSYTNTRRMLPG